MYNFSNVPGFSRVSQLIQHSAVTRIMQQMQPMQQSMPTVTAPPPLLDQWSPTALAKGVPLLQSLDQLQSLGHLFQGEGLSRGSKGEKVEDLQGWLTGAGYPTAVDGDFGVITEGKLKHFQKDHGLPITGRMDSATERLLKQEGENMYKETSTGRKLLNTAKRVARELGTVGWCLKGVSIATERALGFGIWEPSAYKAVPHLRRSGKFKEMTGLTFEQLKKLPAGTIVVWDRNPAKAHLGKGYAHGHIAVLDGKGGEYSDHHRSTILNFPRVRGGKLLGAFVPV